MEILTYLTPTIGLTINIASVKSDQWGMGWEVEGGMGGEHKDHKKEAANTAVLSSQTLELWKQEAFCLAKQAVHGDSV